MLPAAPNARLMLVGAVLVAAALTWWLGPTWGLDLDLAAWQQNLLARQRQQPWLFGLGYFALFTVMAALAIPGCGLLSLAAGACFGWLGGTLLVLLASTAGATLSFLVARHWLRDAVQRRWGDRLAAVEAGIARDGVFYLVFLRLAPIIPFPLLNPLLGLSKMPTRRFVGASLLGMLAGSAVYVHAGCELARVGSLEGLVSPSVLSALALLVMLPWGLQRWARRATR